MKTTIDGITVYLLPVTFVPPATLAVIAFAQRTPGTAPTSEQALGYHLKVTLTVDDQDAVRLGVGGSVSQNVAHFDFTAPLPAGVDWTKPHTVRLDFYDGPSRDSVQVHDRQPAHTETVVIEP